MFNFFKYTEAKLAKDIIAICQEMFPEEDFHYDETLSSVKSSRHDIYLGNILEQSQTLGRGERDDYLRHFLNSALGEQKIDYDSSSHLLMPRIKSTAELHAWADYLGLSCHSQFQYKAISRNFVCMLGLDRHNTIHSVMADDLKKMDMSFDEAYKHAMANLYQKSEAPFEEINDGLYIADFKDGHNAARLMLTDQIKNLKVKGDPVAFLPTNDELVICGSEDFRYFDDLAKQCQAIAKDAKPLSFDTLILKDGQWQDFYPPRTDEYASIHNLHKIERATQYNDQQKQLEEKFKSESNNTYISPHSLYEREDNPFFFSVCTWPENHTSWLPVADMVHFVVKLEGQNDNFGVMAALSWQDTLEHFGHLMTPLERVPMRFEVKGFPDKQQLLQLVEKLSELQTSETTE